MMTLQSFVRHLRGEIRERRDFGLLSGTRRLQRQSAKGYVTFNTRFGKFFIRPHDTDISVLRQVFVDKEYNLDRFEQSKYIDEFYAKSLQAGRVPLIIDAGANAGYATCFFARRYPLARVLSVEPDPENARLCRENTSHLSNVTVVEAAIGGNSGNVQIENSDDGAWGTRTIRSDKGVPIVTVEQLRRSVDRSDLMIVKVDIEGFEADLFSHNLDWIDDTPVIIVEPHDWMLPDRRTSRPLQQAMLGRERDLLISGENVIFIGGFPDR